MPATIELTLQEVAKIALGAPELTHVNIEILHSLINMILKKLDCLNEKVCMRGLESVCLEKMLGASQASSYAFNDEHLKLISTKLDRIIELEEHVASTAEKLEKHLLKIDQSRGIEPIMVDLHKWQEFDIDSIEHAEKDEIDEIACTLLNHPDFPMKIMRRMAWPTIDRIFILEELVEKLNNDLQELVKHAAEQYKKLALIDACMIEMEKIEKIIDHNYLKFIGTMEEVQEMVDLKLDKIRVPALKRCIHQRLNAIREMVTELQVKSECPKEPGIIMNGIKCLSCGGTKVCMDVGVHLTGMMPDWVQKKHTLFRKQCTCSYGSQAQYDETVEKPKVSGKEKNRDSREVTCVKFQVIEGTDGSLYRKG